MKSYHRMDAFCRPRFKFPLPPPLLQSDYHPTGNKQDLRQALNGTSLHFLAACRIVDHRVPENFPGI
jgi:hypothetical protein